MYVVTAGEMQKMDKLTIEFYGIPGIVLMENAGRGAVRTLLGQFPDIMGKKVGIIAGRGNNGGDGFVIARYLVEMGVDVSVYLLSLKEKVKGDAETNLNLLDALDIAVYEMPDEEAFAGRRSMMDKEDLWVDAILGTGLKSDVKGFFKKVIETLNGFGKPVFAVDIPSGLDSDRGIPRGVCIRAAATATFGFPKIGHIIYPGASYTGRLAIIDIGIPRHIADSVNPKKRILTRGYIHRLLKKRAPDAHKGNAGHVLGIAGSPGKTGAAAMTAMSALRIGAGLVTLAVPEKLNPILETVLKEVMTLPAPDDGKGFFAEEAYELLMKEVDGKTCVAIGPGIGENPKQLVRKIVRDSPAPMVIDADGLNGLADNVDILKQVGSTAILTPHPGEMARLTGKPVSDIQSDRIGTARDFAIEFGVHLVLKGARTVIAHPDGEVFVNLTGNSGMAAGGMGDVLTGLIAGLIAQGYSAEAAIHLGVYLHGAAADLLREKIGPQGYLASEVMDAIPEVTANIMNYREPLGFGLRDLES